MKRAKKIPLSIVLAIIFLTCLALPLSGALAMDFLNGVNQLTVDVEYNKNPLPGINVGIYRVATMSTNSEFKVIYTLVPEFNNAVLNWPEEMNITAAELRILADGLARHATTNTIARVAKETNAEGIALFENLDDGLYLVMQESTAGTRYRFSPSLIPVGGYYGATAIMYPKTEPQTPTRPPPPTETPITPTETPTLTPTPTSTVTPTPTVDIPDDDVPLTPFPPDDDGKKPPQIPQTGIMNWDIIIVILTALGIILLTVGYIENRRTRRANDEKTST